MNQLIKFTKLVWKISTNQADIQFSSQTEKSGRGRLSVSFRVARKIVIQVWNSTRVSKWWLDFHPFPIPLKNPCLISVKILKYALKYSKLSQRCSNSVQFVHVTSHLHSAEWNWSVATEAYNKSHYYGLSVFHYQPVLPHHWTGCQGNSSSITPLWTQ